MINAFFVELIELTRQLNSTRIKGIGIILLYNLYYNNLQKEKEEE